MQDCLLILHGGYPGVALGSLTDALGVANWLAREDRYDWTLAADQPALSFAGLSVDAVPLDRVAPTGWRHVFVLASFDPKGFAATPSVIGFLRRAFRAGATVNGIETGAYAMAAAGLLDGTDAAVHWANRDGFQESFPTVPLSDAPMSAAGRRATCVGGTGTLDLALLRIEEDCGGVLALEVAEHLGHTGRYAADRDRRRAHAMAADRPSDRALDRALRAMNDNVEDPVPLKDIAATAGLSQRQIERLFRRRLGMTPKAHYLLIRLTRAQNLLQQTDLSVREIAVSTGFRALSHFSAAYRARFGVAPGRDRVQARDATVPRVFLDPSLTAPVPRS